MWTDEVYRVDWTKYFDVRPEREGRTRWVRGLLCPVTGEKCPFLTENRFRGSRRRVDLRDCSGRHLTGTLNIFGYGTCLSVKPERVLAPRDTKTSCVITASPRHRVTASPFLRPSTREPKRPSSDQGPPDPVINRVVVVGPGGLLYY